MYIKQINRQEINKYLLEYSKRIEAALIYNLEALVAELVNHAKLSAGYNDQTSNLKSSIGGMVLKNGKPITYRGFVSEGGAKDGAKDGLAFANSIVSQIAQKGYALLIVAGMNYATYVENYHNLNVLKKTELKAESDIKQLLNVLKAQLS